MRKAFILEGAVSRGNIVEAEREPVLQEIRTILG